MSNLASLNVKIDKTVKKEADTIANAMGITLSAAINIFVRQMVSERAIPFRVCVVDREADKFHELLNDMRNIATEHGFMSDDEINTEIANARNSTKVQA